MIINLLDKLNITYDVFEHAPVYTANEAQFIKKHISGVGCKNLFLKSDTNKYYLYLLPDDKLADIKSLEKFLHVKKLHFALATDLENILNLKQGGVTPLGIINDKNNLVTIIIDEHLKNKRLLMHPEVNTKTLSIEYNDLIKYIKYLNHNYLNFG